MGLRDYGTAQWDGGSPGCDHTGEGRVVGNNSAVRGKSETVSRLTGGTAKPEADGNQRAVVLPGGSCALCGATRVDGQIGLEGSLADFIAALVGVFREVRRVLHPTGTLWVNMGDSYASNWPCNRRNVIGSGSLVNGKRENRPPRMPDGLKEKDLMLVPARLAIALVDDGWWLRSDVIWHKPAPMPESVTDRPTSAHEHIFMFAKQARYFYDAIAVAERSSGVNGGGFSRSYAEAQPAHGAMALDRPADIGTRNLRNVWTIGPEPYAGSHFAVFPRELPRRCIKAGSSEKGCCPACLSPWRRVVEREPADARRLDRDQPGRTGNGRGRGVDDLTPIASLTTGWEPTCTCPPHEPIPCTALDPFAGAGTTGLVADELGRDAILVELSEQYAEMARSRIYGAAPMFAAVEVA